MTVTLDLTTELEKRIVARATAQGLSVEEYNSIMTVAQNNTEIRQKILRRIQPAAE